MHLLRRQLRSFNKTKILNPAGLSCRSDGYSAVYSCFLTDNHLSTRAVHGRKLQPYLTLNFEFG